MKRPVLVFDGDCGFCRLWVERCRHETDGRVDFEPYQTAADRHPEIPRERFGEAIHLFEKDRATRGAEAAFRSLSYSPRLAWLPRIYALPGVSFATESVYRFIAARRPLFTRLTRALWGVSTVPAPIGFTTRVVLAGLGLCYLIAFASFGLQIRGLIGSDGIMPAALMLDGAKKALGAERFWLMPTLAWLSASDAALAAMCAAGALASLGLAAGVLAGPCAFACWALYLSLSTIGSVFMNFQWDTLLLEAGLAACLLAPWTRKPAAPSRGALWLLRLLLIKLMLQSGIVKLVSDAAWRDMSALVYHYWTQPLPTPLAWYADRLPLWFHKLSCAVMFAIELGAPVLILLPRRARIFGAGSIMLLMILISATGNYGFFNLLTAVLCVACLDDRLFGRAETDVRPASVLRGRVVGAFAALSMTIALLQTMPVFGLMPPAPTHPLLAAVAPLRSFNRYGLFAVMTRSRDEIAIEVSADGVDWREWPMRWKPGDTRRAPPWVAPHMPRLDWQFWFAALGGPQNNPWFGNLIFRLLDGSPSVAALMGPMPLAHKPVYARATVYETRFGADAWWTRARKGLFFPVVSLKRG